MEITPEVYAGIQRMLSDDARNILINALKLANGRMWFSVAWSRPELEAEQKGNFKALVALGLLTTTEDEFTANNYVRQDYHFTKLGYNLAKGLTFLTASSQPAEGSER